MGPPMRTWHVYSLVSGFSFLSAAALEGIDVAGPTRGVFLASATVALVLSFISYNRDC